MSKTINSLVQTSIDSKNYTGVVLARLEFKGSDGFVRVANTYQTIYWDEGSPYGEMPYVGVGNLGKLSVLNESNELGATTIQLTLSGIPNETISDAFADEYRNQPVYIWYGTLDTDTYAVEGGQTGPVLIFAGLMDYSTIQFGETATVTVTATSRLSDWERAKGGSFNHSYQRTYVDPTDRGFRWVVSLQNKEISWGRYTLEDGPSGGGRTGRCFSSDTKFIMENGEIKKIKDIQIGDTMLFGGRVEQLMKGDGLDQDWYLYKNVKVTGSHPVLEDGIWIYVRDSKIAEPIDACEFTYSVDNENMLMVAADNIVFSDYKMFPDEQWADVMDKLALDYQNSRDEVLKQEILRSRA